MIQNTQPATLRFQSFYPGYTKTFLAHSSFSDLDVLGKAIWVDGVLQPLDTELDALYLFVSGGMPNTTYSVESAYYDEMIDPELIAARFGISISPPFNITTLEAPSISSYTVVADNVDIGVAPPVLDVELVGSADFIEVQWSVANSDVWTTVYLGGFTSNLSVPNLPVGTLDVRIRGVVNFPDGQTSERSAWALLEDVVLDYMYAPPEAPTNLSFTVAKLAEPAERFDVQVSWDWAIGSGSNAREFVLWRINASQYANNPSNNKWAGASLSNSGTAQSTVIVNHPFNEPQRYRVSSIAWGPETDNEVFGPEQTFEITASTPIDNDFVSQTGIELTYSHIRGLLKTGSVWKQTFNVDAATGAVAIGLLDSSGEAPISFDPVNGNVNVKGQVISEEIVGASFVMANLTGTNPVFRTSNKSSYGDGSSGVWMGYSGTTYQMDMGSSTNYIRWTGTAMQISGSVVIQKTDGTQVPMDDVGSGNSFYSQAISGWSVWNSTQANQFFQSTFGRPPNDYDVLTQYNSASPNTNATRMWDPSASSGAGAWVTSTLTVHGNVIVDGTIRAAKLVADAAIINELGAEVIYDKAAYAGNDPEANYKMKIDLVAGSIHIR